MSISELKINHEAKLVLQATGVSKADFADALAGLHDIPNDATVSFQYKAAWSDQRDNYTEPATLTVTFSW